MGEVTNNTEHTKELNEKRRRKVKRQMYLKGKCKHYQTKLKGFPKLLPDHRLTILVAVSVLTMISLYRKEIAKVVTSYWVDPVMSQFYEAPGYIYWLAVVIGGYYILACCKERKTSDIRIRLLSFITFAVGLAYIYNQKEQLWIFASELRWIFAVSWIGEIVLWIKHEYSIYKRYIISDSQSLILDHPIEETKKDQYKRSNYSRIVTEKINNNFHEKGAFVTGLSGSWGYGKTSFLNMMKRHIDQIGKNSNIDIHFYFEPWRSSSPDAIVSDFMNQLAEKIEPYIPRIKRRLIKYADSISSFDSTPYLSDFFKIVRVSIDDSLEKQYEKLSNDLRKAGVNILVFIDDTDRLAPDEIVEVFRLVRNSANFPYMQFVVTYDRDYIMKSLGESTHKITDPDTYMEKIFNVELALPAFEGDIVKDELLKELKARLTIDTIHKETISNFFKTNSDNFPIYKLIKTKRDLIRFINSLQINFNALNTSEDDFSFTDINIVDFLKIELIRYKYPSFYNDLLNNPGLYLDLEDEGNEHYTFFPEASSLNHNDAEQDKLKGIDRILIAAMINLFPSGRPNNPNSISMLRAFDQYFMYRCDSSNISYTETLNLLNEPSSEKQYNVVKEFDENKREDEILEMIKKLTELLVLRGIVNHPIDRKMKSTMVFKLVHIIISVYEKDIRPQSTEIIKSIATSVYPLFTDCIHSNYCTYIYSLTLWDRLIHNYDQHEKMKVFTKLIEEADTNKKYFIFNEVEDTIRFKVEIKKYLQNVQNKSDISILISEYISSITDDSKLILDIQTLKNITKQYKQDTTPKQAKNYIPCT